MAEKDDGKEPFERRPETATLEANGSSKDTGGTAGTATREGTVVSLAPFRSVYLGLAAGSAFKVRNLVGSDLNGEPWTGSYLLLADGLRILEGRTLTRSREVITLKTGEGVPVISMSTRYFRLDGSGIYKVVFNSGITYVPISQAPFPALMRVGERGTLGVFEGSDFSTVTVGWELKPDFNGYSTLEINSVATGEGGSATEVDSFLLDSSGIPRKVTMSASAADNNVTVYGRGTNIGEN
ncbi:hypothetical protein GMSM_29260 [Geomonas sp. Red276]